MEVILTYLFMNLLFAIVKYFDNRESIHSNKWYQNVWAIIIMVSIGLPLAFAVGSYKFAKQKSD